MQYPSNNHENESNDGYIDYRAHDKMLFGSLIYNKERRRKLETVGRDKFLSEDLKDLKILKWEHTRNETIRQKTNMHIPNNVWYVHVRKMNNEKEVNRLVNYCHSRRRKRDRPRLEAEHRRSSGKDMSWE